MRLLIVEDNEELAELLAKGLQKAGYQADVLSTVEDARGVLGITSYAAMILDLVRDLKRKGEVSIIIIAHNYGQVLEICDRVNLLQHGEITLDKPAAETSVQELNDIVIEEYRAALQARHRAAG